MIENERFREDPELGTEAERATIGALMDRVLGLERRLVRKKGGDYIENFEYGDASTGFVRREGEVLRVVLMDKGPARLSDITEFDYNGQELTAGESSTEDNSVEGVYVQVSRSGAVDGWQETLKDHEIISRKAISRAYALRFLGILIDESERAAPPI